MVFRNVSNFKGLMLNLFVLCSCICSITVLAENPKILIYGDSLSASYGLTKQQGWGFLLQKKLISEHHYYDVFNASISGETTAGGLSRLPSTLLKVRPSIILIELGANDGLRGLPLKDMYDNLSSMIVQCKKNKIKILLIGMKMPPSYGPQYTQNFNLQYIQLSQIYNLPLVPFMLENIAGIPDLIQEDGLHPNALGQPIILENVWKKLEEILHKGKMR